MAPQATARKLNTEFRVSSTGMALLRLLPLLGALIVSLCRYSLIPSGIDSLVPFNSNKSQKIARFLLVSISK